jgi:hypothetical protein
MIAQYKREEEEQNRYVDPTGAEFKYAPEGTVPILSTSTLVNVPSLGAPATLTVLRTEEANYNKIYQDILHQKQEIIDKIREGK